jgi:hypothetical protein
MEINRRLGPTHCLHLQVENWAVQETDEKQAEFRRYFPLERWLTFTGLHGDISQKI